MRHLPFLLALGVLSCASPAAESLRAAELGPGPTVLFDVYHRPLPEIPLPNDYATRVDGNSPTHRRVNASIEVAPTQWEKRTRAGLDALSGWGTLAPITVAFSEALDVRDIAQRHQRPSDISDDAFYVIDVTQGSPERCQVQLLDVGQGHFPTIGDDRDYYPDEPHRSFEQLLFEQEEEDLDGDGVLDPGEDTDMDGVLDHPNTLDRSAGPFDVMSFYERETNTLIARPLYPLREATTYAVVLTNRLRGADGHPVRSPFSGINHVMQTRALAALPECLAGLNLGLEDVAFTWSFTTQSVTSDIVAVREGLYSRGSLGWLGNAYPGDFLTLEDVRKRETRQMNTKILPGAQFAAFGARLFELYGGGGGATSGTRQVLDDELSFVDFYSSASFVSPQLFPRDDAEGHRLPLYDQVWDVNPATGAAYHRPESVNVFMSVPKGRKGPAPVVIFLHGHTSSKLDSLIMMGPMARAGLATIGLDAVSHGVGIDAATEELVTEVVKPYGLEPAAKAILQGRALDQNGDGIDDSGVDYWTAYVLHTRDVVRQTTVDVMQLIRVLKSFDGQRRWAFDANRDGEPDLAGDFDGDGVVDLGGPDVPIYMAGASLGGILTSMIGGVEPSIDRMLAILPAGYLSEVGSRSALGQVREAMILRMMAPLLLVHPDETGAPALFQFVPDLTRSTERKVAPVPALQPGRIAVARNLKTGEWRCARVQPNGHLRVAVSSDDQDPLRVELYDEELPSMKREGCDPTGFTPSLTIDAWAQETAFQGRTYAAGSPLVALGDGFGLKRGSPELRRLMGLAQVALEACDPANFAPFYDGTRTLTYPTGETVSTPALMVPMTGDPGVTIAAGTALLRAAGFVDYKNVDPRYGKTQMQQLIDLGFVEGVERTGRWKDSTGRNVLYDVDVLQAVANADDGFGVPRLSPPMRLLKQSEKFGETVGALFPMMNPLGEHSFPVPDPNKPFDLGMLLINIFGTYLSTGTVPLEPCMEDTTCPWIKPVGSQ
jgi:hypothetical protein